MGIAVIFVFCLAFMIAGVIWRAIWHPLRKLIIHLHDKYLI
jgi:hypothetical protein